MDVSYNARRLSNIPEGNRGSSSSIFTSKDGSPLRVFVESSGITNRPELVRLLRANGAAICSDVAVANIIIVEPKSKEGSQFIRDWDTDPHQSILEVSWIKQSINAGHALLEDEDWGGCGNLEGAPLSDEEEEEEAIVRPPIRSKRISVHHSRRQSDQPIHNNFPSSQPVPFESSISSMMASFMNSHMPESQQILLQASQNQQPDMSNMALAPFGQYPSTSMPMNPPTQAFSQELLTQAAGFLLAMQAALNPGSQPWQASPFMQQSQQNGFPMSQHQLPYNVSHQNTQMSQAGPSGSQLSPVTPFSQGTGSSSRINSPLPLDDSSDHGFRSRTAQKSSRRTKRKLRSTEQPTAPSESTKRRKSKGQNNGARKSSIKHDPDLGDEHAHITSLVSLYGGSDSHEKNQTENERRQEKSVQGFFTNYRTGKPTKFFIQVQIYKHAEYVRRVKKNGGVMTSNLSDADIILLDARAGKDRDVLLRSVSELGHVALKISYLDACFEEGALVEEEDFIIESPFKPKVKHAPKRAPVRRNRTPESEEEDESVPSPKEVFAGGSLLTEDGESPSTKKLMKEKTTQSRGRKSIGTVKPIDNTTQHSPTPPSEPPRPRLGGFYLYTEGEIEYVYKLARHLFRQNPSLTMTKLGEALSEKVPSHSAKAWAAKISERRLEIEAIREEVTRSMESPVLSKKRHTSSRSEVEENQVEAVLRPSTTPASSASVLSASDNSGLDTNMGLLRIGGTFGDNGVETERDKDNGGDKSKLARQPLPQQESNAEIVIKSETTEITALAPLSASASASAPTSVPPITTSPHPRPEDVKSDMNTIINFFVSPPEGVSSDEALWDALSNQQKCMTSECWQDFYDQHREEVNSGLRKALNLSSP